MKHLKDLAAASLPEQCSGKIVELIAVLGGWKKLENPTLSTELECTVCSGKAHYAIYSCPQNDPRRIWICANGSCETNSVRGRVGRVNAPTPPSRAILWPLFCEINGIGDIHHDVKFEDVKQSEGKVAYMLKFAITPRGIILMQGDPGTGKTYAAMAICELYTRKDTAAIFTTQKQMSNNWLDTFKAERYSNYIERVSNANLLVIDDFGTAEMPPGFMSFFMDLINTRMQWSNRGTVITTNLESKKFGLFCGEALSDRINTGQQFDFKGKTRRKQNPL